MQLDQLKHYCLSELIEFKVTDRLDDEKNAHMLKNEPVRLINMNSYMMLASILDSEKTVSVRPINKHTESIVEKITGNGLQIFAEVNHHEKKIIQVLVKQFSEVKPLNYSINVSDECIRGFLKIIQVNNIYKPIDEINHATKMTQGIYSYVVIGVHVKVHEKNKFDEFIIAADSFYIQVKKQVDEFEKEYYSAVKIIKNIKKNDYKFFLAKGNLKFTDEKEAVKEEVLQAIGGFKNSSYIKVWDRYGELERKIIFNKACDLGALKYDNLEPEASMNMVRVDIHNDPNMDKRLKVFQKEFTKGDIVNLSIINPFDKSLENDLNSFMERNKKYIVNAKLASDINITKKCIYLILDEQGLQLINQMKNGYIFMSIQGDEKRLKRREIARKKIENLTNPMPNLAAILEGKSVSKPRKKHIPALSELVKNEIFTNKKTGIYRPPTEKQASAIEMALNTPDIALIQGPPGTGKTTVITAILKRLDEEADSTNGMFGRNLVTAFQHDAVQNAIDRIEILGLPAIKFGKKYSDIEDDFADINSSIQNWINEKLVDMNMKHYDILNKKYFIDYNKIFTNYMYSARTIDQTITILEEVRDVLSEKLSLELLNDLNLNIKELKYKTRGRSEASLISLNRTIRKIPINEAAFSDDGRGNVHFAIMMLRKQNNPEFKQAILDMEKMEKEQKYDFNKLKKIRKSLLVQIIPKEKIFTEQGKRDEVTSLLVKITEYLLEQIEGSKQGEDLVVLQYMQALEENPLAVKNAILDYTSVNGATNQQVMRREISLLKGGDIVYDNVLVDEAARSNPLDLFIPLSVARDRIILVGDHRQLPHMVDEQIVNELEKENEKSGDLKELVQQKIKESMFEQLFEKLKMLEKADGIKRTITLDKQYRMHPTLGKFVNDNFYEKYSQSEKVGNGIEDAKVFEHSLPGIENKACIWMDVPFEAGKENSGKSKSRDAEAEKIAKHLKKMLDSNQGKNYTYGIITFYREQVNRLYEALSVPEIGIFVKDESDRYVLSSEYWNRKCGDREYIKIGTVDAFQGMEFDFVYLSTVRSNDYEVPQKGSEEEISKAMQKKYGFLMYENRLCVAMSRQKRALICVGDKNMLNGIAAEKAIPSLVEYYKLCCREDEYGKVI